SELPDPGANERLQAVVDTADGLALADHDLRLRGPGDFFGVRQSGLPELKVARLDDAPMIEAARSAAIGILERDPELSAPEHASLIEHSRDAARIIEANLRSTGFTDQALVLIGPVVHMLGRARGPFDLVLADPPYTDASVLRAAVAALEKEGVLLPDSVVVLEQPATDEAPAAIGELPLASTRKHGRTRNSLYATSRAPVLTE